MKSHETCDPESRPHRADAAGCAGPAGCPGGRAHRAGDMNPQSMPLRLLYAGPALACVRPGFVLHDGKFSPSPPAREAVSGFGTVRGGKLAVPRLLHCRVVACLLRGTRALRSLA